MYKYSVYCFFVSFDFTMCLLLFVFFFSSRRRHTRCLSDWSSDVCSSDLDALNQLGYFQHASATGSVRGLFSSDRARGRITIDRGDDSWTLLSLRGLGLQNETRAIPQIYAAAKEAIFRLKNSAPNLRVQGGTIGDRDPSRAKAAGTGAPPPTPSAPAGGGAPASGAGTDSGGK